MIIETDRLILREYTMDDLENIYKILSCPITMSHYIKPYDYEGAKRWINWCMNSYKENGFGLWAMILKETNTLIGDCGLSLQNIDGEICPEIGYHIYKDYWRNGYGKEAANAVKEWAFNNTKYNTLYSYMTTTNIASYKTAEAIGMIRIKEYRDDSEELAVYAITK
jgi:RimJ/RimL family protein N-acetyltransferase